VGEGGDAGDNFFDLGVREEGVDRPERRFQPGAQDHLPKIGAVGIRGGLHLLEADDLPPLGFQPVEEGVFDVGLFVQFEALVFLFVVGDDHGSGPLRTEAR